MGFPSTSVSPEAVAWGPFLLVFPRGHSPPLAGRGDPLLVTLPAVTMAIKTVWAQAPGERLRDYLARGGRGGGGAAISPALSGKRGAR